MSQGESDSNIDRRRVLQSLAAAGAAGVAGCMGEENPDDEGTSDDDGGETPGGEDTPEPTDPDTIVEGGTLEVGLRINPTSFDPPFSLEAPDSLVHNLFWESLITTDRQGNIYPWLASGYELMAVNEVEPADYEDYMISVEWEEDEDGNPVLPVDDQVVIHHPDNVPGEGEAQVLTVNETQDAVDDGVFGMQYRFNLHEGIEFHNGEELTAENVVRSYERYENSYLAGQTFDRFLHAEVIDDYTVDLYAQEPDAEADRELPVLVFSTEQIDLPPSELDPRQGNPPVGTSPWEFDEFEDEEYLVVAKNENYWLEDVGLESKEWWDGPDEFPNSPAIDEIDMEFITDPSTRTAALENEEVDLTYRLPADQRTNFDQSDDFAVATAPGSGYLFGQLPVRVEPWDDANVRRAFNHCIPRTQIVENIRDGWSSEAWAPVPRVAAGAGTHDYEALEDDLKEYNEFDLERAEELVQESGVETPIEATLITNSDDSDRVKVVELIVEAMNQTEVFDAELETPGDLSTLVVNRYMDPEWHKKGEIAFVGLSGTFNPDSFVRAVHHPDNFAQCCNFQNIDFPELNEAMDRAQFGMDVLDDPDLRRDRYEEIWEMVQEINANSYVDYELTTAVYNSRDIHGFGMYPFPTGLLSYGLFSPQDEQITWIDRD